MRGVTPQGVALFRIDILFLLTRLMRGVTISCGCYTQTQRISTHTPHARRDVLGGKRQAALVDFYSHASCEA